MFEITFDEEAINFLNTLEKSKKERIFKKVMVTSETPLRYFERLTGRTDYKLRVGDYRIIADIDNNLKKIEIRIVGHRNNIYNKI